MQYLTKTQKLCGKHHIISRENVLGGERESGKIKRETIKKNMAIHTKYALTKYFEKWINSILSDITPNIFSLIVLVFGSIIYVSRRGNDLLYLQNG